MNLKLAPKSVTIDISNAETLAYLAYSMDQAIQWFLGEGVWQWSVKRSNYKDGISVDLIALVEPKLNAYGSVANFKTLSNVKYIPFEIPIDEIWTADQKKTTFPLIDGVNRVAKYLSESSKGWSLLNSVELRPELTMGEYAWGLGDTLVGAFQEGATQAKHQISMQLSQTWFNVGIDKMQEFFQNDYDSTLKIRTLR